MKFNEAINNGCIKINGNEEIEENPKTKTFEIINELAVKTRNLNLKKEEITINFQTFYVFLMAFLRCSSFLQLSFERVEELEEEIKELEEKKHFYASQIESKPQLNNKKMLVYNQFNGNKELLFGMGMMEEEEEKKYANELKEFFANDNNNILSKLNCMNLDVNFLLHKGIISYEQYNVILQHLHQQPKDLIDSIVVPPSMQLREEMVDSYWCKYINLNQAIKNKLIPKINDNKKITKQKKTKNGFE